MTNEGKEFKNNAPYEEKKATREITPEEMEKVTGGIGECDHFVSTGLEVQITELEITTNS